MIIRMILPYDQIISELIKYKYIFLFPITIVEGPIITIIAGFLSSSGYMNPIIVYMIAMAGDIIGDVVYYAIGRWGRTGFINRWGRWIGLNSQRVIRLEGHFKNHGGKTLLFGKWTQTLGAPILVAAGMVNMDFKKYMGFNILGSAPKIVVFILLGYYFGQAYLLLDKYLTYFSIAMTVLVLIAIGLYYFSGKISKKLE